jgi:hypothetical protein
VAKDTENSTAGGDDTGIVEDVRATIDLLKRYAKQETIVPLKGVGKYLGLGVAGSVLVAIGALLLALSALRALQDETGSTFDGNWSFVPYLIVVAGLLLLVGLAVWAIVHEPDRST